MHICESCNYYTLQGTITYPIQWERTLIFPTAFGWDMLGSREGKYHIQTPDFPLKYIKNT